MSRLFLKLILCSSFVLSSANVLAKTFKEALDECAGQNTEYCNKVRIVYNKKKSDLAEKKRKLLAKPVGSSSLPASNIAEKANERFNKKLDKPVVAEEKSPFGIGYFSEISGIGKEDDDGESEIGIYTHFDFGYTFKNGLTMYFRTPFSIDPSTAGDEDSFTMHDPYAGIKGTIWKSGNWSFWSRLRMYAPLSQASTDDGVTMGWGTDHKIGYSDKFDFYVIAMPRGKFYGFGTDSDRNNGSLNFEVGIEGVSITDNLGIFAYYNSGFSRKVGRDIGYLVFNDSSQVVNLHLGYKIGSGMTILPGVSYNLDDSETSFLVWFWGSIF